MLLEGVVLKIKQIFQRIKFVLLIITYILTELKTVYLNYYINT